MDITETEQFIRLIMVGVIPYVLTEIMRDKSTGNLLILPILVSIFFLAQSRVEGYQYIIDNSVQITTILSVVAIAFSYLLHLLRLGRKVS